MGPESEKAECGCWWSKLPLPVARQDTVIVSGKERVRSCEQDCGHMRLCWAWS